MLFYVLFEIFCKYMNNLSYYKGITDFLIFFLLNVILFEGIKLWKKTVFLESSRCWKCDFVQKYNQTKI